MTGEYGHAIVIAKLRHCAKFRCTEVLHRIVDGILGRGGKRKRERDREREGGKGLPGEKGGQKSDQATQPPGPDARREGGRRRRGRRSRWRTLQREGWCAMRPEAEARAGATGSDLVILSLAIPLAPYPSSPLPSLPVTVPPRCRDSSTLPSSI